MKLSVVAFMLCCSLSFCGAALDTNRIEQITGGALHIQQGALYPALYRLESQGLIESEWGVSENNRRAKYYTLTAAGRKQLLAEAAAWLAARSFRCLPAPCFLMRPQLNSGTLIWNDGSSSKVGFSSLSRSFVALVLENLK